MSRPTAAMDRAPSTTSSPLASGTRALREVVQLDARIVAVFIASRLLVILVALAVESLAPREPGFVPGADGPILTSLTSWDGFYYMSIVTHGYQAQPVAGSYSNVAFAPLYPLLVGLLARPFPGFEGLVSIVTSNLAFLAALPLLVRLGTPYLGPDRASRAAVLLIIYPFAAVFAMAYTESLFLLLTVGAFLAAERGHRATAGVLVALAVLCRLQGVVLILPLLILMLRQDGWRPRPSDAWLLLGPVAFAGFLAYVAAITGSPTGFLDAQQAWGREGVGGAAPDETIAASFSIYQAALLATLLWSVFLLVYVRADRLRLEYALVPVLFMAAALSSGSLEAIGRITMLAFPYVWLLARRESVLARRVWPVVSISLFVVIAILMFAGIWVP
jgi:hypothetical protein